MSTFSINRTTDNGNTWTGIKGKNLTYRIAINAEGDIFIYGHDIYRSLDDGKSWAELTISDSPHVSIQSMAINSKGHVFASGYRGPLYHSVDNGDSWTNISLGSSVSKVFINNENHIFAKTSAGFSRLIYEGDTWTENILLEGRVRLLGFNPDYHIFVVTDGDLIIRSIDNGNTWELLGSLPVPPEDTAFNHMAINSRNHIFVSNEEIPVFDGIDQGQGVFRSTDGAESWTYIGPDSTSIHNILFIDSKDYLFASTGAKLYRSKEPTNY